MKDTLKLIKNLEKSLNRSIIGIIIAAIVIGIFLLALTNPNLRENKETWFGFIDVIPEESISGKEQCEITGGLWGIWGNSLSTTASCNPATSDVGKECTDSSQCQSFCQAKEGSEINSESIGMCYGHELAICMQEVRNGVVQNEWCQ